MNTQKILDDWQNGKSHGQIIREHNITREQEFAIYSTTLYSDRLNVDEISARVEKIKLGMKATEIISVMRTNRAKGQQDYDCKKT